MRSLSLLLVLALLLWLPDPAAAQNTFAPTDYYLISEAGTTISGADDAAVGVCTLRDALGIVNAGITAGPANGCQIQQVGAPAAPVYLINLPAGLVYTLNGAPLQHTAHTLFVNGNGATIQGAPARAAAYNVLEASGTADTNWADLTFRWGLGIDIIGGVLAEFINVTVAEHNDSGLSIDRQGAPFVVPFPEIAIRNSRFLNNIALNGGGINIVDGIVLLQNSSVNNNQATGVALGEGGGGLFMEGGRLISEGVEYVDNVAAGLGGGIRLGDQVDVNGGFFLRNQAAQGGAINIQDFDELVTDGVLFQENQARIGGAIFMTGGNAELTLTNGIFSGNVATDVNGGGGVHIGALAGNAVLDASNNCFQDSTGGGVVNSNAANQDFSNNWWGAPSGPGGDFGGTGDDAFGALTVAPVIATQPPNCDTIDVLPKRDFYSTEPGERITPGAADGLLFNDDGVLSGTARLRTDPDSGTATVNGDGSFSYTPDPGFSGVSAFEYEGSDGFGIFQSELACITVGDLLLEVPGQQVAQEGVPLPIPDVSFELENIADAGTLRAMLTVADGVLNVDGGQDGFVPPLALRCDPPLGVHAAPPGPVVWEGTFSKQAPSFSHGLQMAGLMVSGNGTSELTLEGTRTQVNVALDTLTYTANAGFEGVDQILVRGTNVSLNQYAHAQINILVGLRDAPPPGEPPAAPPTDGGGDVPTVVVDEDGNIVAPEAPLADVTLRLQERDGDSPVYADVPQGVIVNGDVFVRLLVFRGEYLVDPGEIGDDELVQQGIETAADVFGLTFGGASVSEFDLPVRVCLLGTGTFYYRDATLSPRVTVVLPTTVEGGYTCASISASGTVILVPDSGDLPDVRVEGDPDQLFVRLTDCMVTTTNIVNLREGPSETAPIIRPIPFNVTLTAVIASAAWFEVDYLGTFGWVNEDFVTTAGDCG